MIPLVLFDYQFDTAEDAERVADLIARDLTDELPKLDEEEKFRHRNMANFEKVLEYIKDK